MRHRADKERVPAEDRALFREAVRGAHPIRETQRVVPEMRPIQPPVPVQSLLDNHDTLKDSLTGNLDLDQMMETGEEATYLRPGLPRDLLRRLRRGHWIVQDQLDLHGMNSEQAHRLLTQFLTGCSRRNMRCIRIVHGKGLRSPNREPVLKNKVRVWLVRRADVLAFCQAPNNQGGSGALLVLLKS